MAEYLCEIKHKDIPKFLEEHIDKSLRHSRYILFCLIETFKGIYNRYLMSF